MLELIAMFILSRMNGQKAERKGYRFMKFFWRTVLLFLLGELLGSLIVTLLLMNKGVDPTDQKALIDILTNNWELGAIALALGVGGYLIVRRQIEKLPEKKLSDL